MERYTGNTFIEDILCICRNVYRWYSVFESLTLKGVKPIFECELKLIFGYFIGLLSVEPDICLWSPVLS